MSRRRIYLDNAATSWPKPAAVGESIARWYREEGASAGRGLYRSAIAAGEVLERCRLAIAELTGAGTGDAVVLTRGGTEALNLAIHGLLRPGDHVLATSLEHNSVLRPLFAARDQIGATVELVPPDADGRLAAAAFTERLRPESGLVCLTHASNVTGAVHDVAGVAEVCRRAGVPLLVDASQTAGKIPIRMAEWGCDLLAAAGHKGLFGPMGTGFLVVARSVADKVRATRQGGTGGDSREERQPEALPGRLECGSPDVAAFAGLLEGIRFVQETGVGRLAAHDRHLDGLLRAQLGGLGGLALTGPVGGQRVAVTGLMVEGLSPHAVAMALDASFGIEVRSGLHCAPWAVTRHGEPVETLRLSPGWFNTAEDIERACEAIRSVVA